jgi:hypothetical protein
MIEGRGQQVLEMRGVLRDLLLILLFCDQIDSPTLVHLWNEMHALRVVYTILFPAFDELIL